MNGAQSLMQALSDAGVKICFTNPGTTEIHLLSAMDSVPQMRPVLGLFEGVCSGAADGYARMTRRPAATLFHLGPGLANAMANLHNARRARSPVVNLVGDHPSYHKRNDPPLSSDIAAMASTVSGWIQEASSASQLPANGIAAVEAACRPPGQVATLVVPSDCAWSQSRVPAPSADIPGPAPVTGRTVETVAEMLLSGGPAALMLGGEALLEPGLTAAGRIAEKTGAALISATFDARFTRGAGLPVVKRLPYFPESAEKRLAGYSRLILAGAGAPQPFFAYPDTPVRILPEGCEITTLAAPGDDVTGALLSLAEALDAGRDDFSPKKPGRPEPPTGPLTDETAGAALGALLCENAIVSDESGTSGLHAYRLTAGAPSHDWLCLTGGSIGQGMPVATGAAIACPDRPVISLQGDGGAMYTIQALWTQAREGLDVTTVIFSNRKYLILQVELQRLGLAGAGSKILDTMNMDRPAPDWVKLAEGMGVYASRAQTADEFYVQLKKALAEPGPHLIEAVL